MMLTLSPVPLLEDEQSASWSDAIEEIDVLKQGHRKSEQSERTGLEQKIDQWLHTPEIGLAFDPFRHVEASQDSRLPLYLVDHDAFEELWGDHDSFVFAPAGGGKTAFRLRLTHACRSRERGRSRFPVILKSVDPHRSAFDQVYREAARELLLQILYFPSAFLDLDRLAKDQVASYIDVFFPDDAGVWPTLDQVEDVLNEEGAAFQWSRLAAIFDPAVGGLAIPPGKGEVLTVIRVLRSAMRDQAVSQVRDPLSSLWSILSELGYESIFLMIDGVDAFPETQRGWGRTISALTPFFGEPQIWAHHNIYLKCFLPIELHKPMFQRFPHLLTSPAKTIIIKWTPELVQEVIRRRLHAASATGSAITTLDALSSPGLRRVEEKVVQFLEDEGHLLPREAVYFIERLLEAHILRSGPSGKLTPADFEEAARRYRQEVAGNHNGNV